MKKKNPRLMMILTATALITGCGSTTTTTDSAVTNSSPSIDTIWKYHTDTYQTSTNITDRSGTYALPQAWIGDVQVVRFASGEGYVAINGTVEDATTETTASGLPNHSHSTFYDFSHTRYLASTTGTQTLTFKVDGYADMVATYKIDFSQSPPTLTTSIDTDKNAANDPSVTISLSL